jgi:hypothetical protein
MDVADLVRQLYLNLNASVHFPWERGCPVIAIQLRNSFLKTMPSTRFYCRHFAPMPYHSTFCSASENGYKPYETRTLLPVLEKLRH